MANLEGRMAKLTPFWQDSWATLLISRLLCCDLGSGFAKNRESLKTNNPPSFLPVFWSVRSVIGSLLDTILALCWAMLEHIDLRSQNAEFRIQYVDIVLGYVGAAWPTSADKSTEFSTSKARKLSRAGSSAEQIYEFRSSGSNCYANLIVNINLRI